MSARSIIATVVVVAAEGLGALFMVVISVHGPSGLAVAAPVYFVAAAALTCWIASRYSSSLAVLGTGVLMIAVIPATIAVLDRVESIRYERRIAATRVTDVRDEPILSAAGRSIGVRVSYRLSVPGRGYFGITPSLYGRGPRTERLSLNAARWTINGSKDPVRFEPGKSYEMVVEMYPAILFFKKDERCLATASLSDLPRDTVATPLRIVVSESQYGATYHGGRDEVTRGAYDIAQLYRGVLAEGLEPCG